MEKSYNIRDVAKAAGVSPGTVSRVLNNRMGKMKVSEATKARILQCAKDMNYHPNINARRLFSKRCGVIGLIIPSFSNVFSNTHVSALLNGIEKSLKDKNYKLMVLFKNQKFIDSEEYLTLYRSKQIDGLLIWGAHRNETFWNELAVQNRPHAFITTYPDGAVEPKRVFTADYANSSYLMMRHLLKQKHRRIMWLTPQEETSLYFELKKGVEKACHESGVLMEDFIEETPCDYHPEAGYAFMQNLCKSFPQYPALLFTSCDSAAGALNYCLKSGIRVPDDVAIAACDNLDYGNKQMKITCASYDDIQLGTVAMEGLIAQIEGKTIPVKNCIETKFFQGTTA